MNPRYCAIAFLILSLWCATARGQIHSAAFEKNCYQPGYRPGEIDTILGSHKGDFYGGGLVNIGSKPGNPGGPGRLMFTGPNGDPDSYSAVDCGSNFDPHNMTVAQFKGFWAGSRMTFGHFRSKRNTDALLLDSVGARVSKRIYWSDEQGNFDISNFTILGYQHNILTGDDGSARPYHAYLTSDTAEDLIMSYAYYPGVGRDSQFLAHFVGGASLFKRGEVVFATEEEYFDSAHVHDGYYPGGPDMCYSADFRGTGRLDCVAANARGDLFFYANDPPFSLHKLVTAMRDDTLLSVRSGPRINSGSAFGYFGATITKAFGPNDRFASLALFVVQIPQDSQLVKIFHGGRDFGSHPITIDSAAFTIRGPDNLDPGTFGGEAWRPGQMEMRDCGDMTGTGTHVLCIMGIDFLVCNYNFYLLGEHPDDHVKMYFGVDGGGGGIDTCTIDGDGLQDVAIGAPGYNDDGTLTDPRGAVFFIHGSKKIPVPTGAVAQAALVVPSLTAERSQDGESLLLRLAGEWASGTCTFECLNILGQRVRQVAVPLNSDGTCTVPLPGLARGAYVVQLSVSGKTQRTKVKW